MTNIEQIIARQEEKLPKLIVDLVWSVTDGGCKLKENQLLSYQDEPVREYEDIINWHSSSIKEILEGVKQRTEEDILKLKENWETLSDLDKSIIIIKIESKTDTINYLESIIKKL